MADARYFQDELTYLRESGRAFAAQNPKLVKYLSERSTDPDVERLLEGFAFLTSKLREKLDDELPELTHSVINLLLPNFLRPFPSTTLMKLTPLEKAITERQVVPRGSDILSLPVQGLVCPFVTTADTEVYPFDISQQRLERTRANTNLHIDFKTLSGLPLSKLDMRNLRLWFTGDEVGAQTLYLWFRRYLKSATIRFHKEGEHESSEGASIDVRKILPGGFGQDEAILPDSAAYEGYRLLQEYFVFPRKFLCVDLVDLGRLCRAREASEFSLHFTFERPMPADIKVRPGTIQLYCVPAINLFPHDGEPMKIDHRKIHYPIRPSANSHGALDIFSIERVMSWRAVEDPNSRSHLRDYPPFESFHHEVERASGLTQIYYRQRLRASARRRGMEHLLSFVRHDNGPAVPEHEVLSTALLCFNGLHAPELGTGDIHIQTEETPSFVEFSNLFQPTQPVFPPLDGSLYWSLISNMSLNYISLLDRDALAAVINIYDFRARADRQAERAGKLRMDGILSIETQPFDKLFRGQPVRGLSSRMKMSEDAFQSEGDMYLFASILAEFFSMYASVNSFHELLVECEESNEIYQWQAKIGRQPLI